MNTIEILAFFEKYLKGMDNILLNDNPQRYDEVECRMK